MKFVYKSSPVSSYVPDNPIVHWSIHQNQVGKRNMFHSSEKKQANRWLDIPLFDYIPYLWKWMHLWSLHIHILNTEVLDLKKKKEMTVQSSVSVATLYSVSDFYWIIRSYFTCSNPVFANSSCLWHFQGLVEITAESQRKKKFFQLISMKLAIEVTSVEFDETGYRGYFSWFRPN